MWERPSRRVAAYVGWSVGGAVLTAIVAFAWLGAHFGLVAFGITLGGVVVLVSTGELGQWAMRRHAEHPRKWGAMVGAASVASWAVYVLVVALPIANFTTLPVTSSGRGVMFVITFLPLFLFWSAGILAGVVWLRRQPAPGRNTPAHVAR